MSNKVVLEDGRVVITGKSNGHPVTLRGDIKSVKFSAYPEDDFNSIYTLPKNRSYFLEFLTDEDGVAYTLQYEIVTVERRASIDIAAHNLKELNAARAIVGAPEDAAIVIDPLTRSELIIGSGASRVTFVWKEEVRK